MKHLTCSSLPLFLFSFTCKLSTALGNGVKKQIDDVIGSTSKKFQTLVNIVIVSDRLEKLVSVHP